MKFFESEIFFQAFCQEASDEIYYYDNKPVGVIHKSKILSCQLGPFGTWTDVNKSALKTINIINELFKKKVKKIYFTDIDNVLESQKIFLRGKSFDKSQWFQSDFIFHGKSSDELLKMFNRNRRRNYKKFVGNEDAEIVQDNSLVDVFYEILFEHQLAKGYTSMTKDFFSKILETTNRDSLTGAKLFMLKYKGEYIAGEVVFFDNDDYYGFVHALNTKAYSLNIDDYFRMEIINDAVKNGKKRYRFGSTKSNMTELLEFKRRYATVEFPFSVYCFYSGKVFKVFNYLYSLFNLLKPR